MLVHVHVHVFMYRPKPSAMHLYIYTCAHSVLVFYALFIGRFSICRLLSGLGDLKHRVSLSESTAVSVVWRGGAETSNNFISLVPRLSRAHLHEKQSGDVKNLGPAHAWS